MSLGIPQTSAVGESENYHVRKYPQDRFDDRDSSSVPRGAHRTTVRRKPWWVKVVTVVAATSAVIVVALAGITVIDARLNFEIPDFTAIGQTPTPTPTPTIALLDPTKLTEQQFKATTITILNGTTSPTLAADVAAMLTTQNWPQATIADAADDTVAKSVIAYRYSLDEQLARSIGSSLGIDVLQQSDDYFGARVYVVLGADFLK
jgi:hypothetical protein